MGNSNQQGKKKLRTKGRGRSLVGAHRRRQLRTPALTARPPSSPPGRMPIPLRVCAGAAALLRPMACSSRASASQVRWAQVGPLVDPGSMPLNFPQLTFILAGGLEATISLDSKYCAFPGASGAGIFTRWLLFWACVAWPAGPPGQWCSSAGTDLNLIPMGPTVIRPLQAL